MNYKRSGFVAVGLLLLTFNVVAGDTLNIRTAPISDLIGIRNIEIDYTVSDKVTLGPLLYSFDYELSDTTFESLAYGLRVNYYFNSVQQGGWLTSLSGMIGDFDISETRSSDGTVFSTSTTERVYTLLLSYQAMWDSFNITTGIGVSYLSFPDTVVATNGVETFEVDTSLLSGVIPNAEFTIGWRF